MIITSSFEQASPDFEHMMAFIRERGRGPDDRRRPRVWDTANHTRIGFRETGARVRCLGSDPARAHGLAPPLVLAHEPSNRHSGVPKARPCVRRCALAWARCELPV